MKVQLWVEEERKGAWRHVWINEKQSEQAVCAVAVSSDNNWLG